jgi:hypothetical protein
MISLGTEPATFQLVAVPHPTILYRVFSISRRSLGRYSSLADSDHGVCLFFFCSLYLQVSRSLDISPTVANEACLPAEKLYSSVAASSLETYCSTLNIEAEHSSETGHNGSYLKIYCNLHALLVECVRAPQP